MLPSTYTHRAEKIRARRDMSLTELIWASPDAWLRTYKNDVVPDQFEIEISVTSLVLRFRYSGQLRLGFYSAHEKKKIFIDSDNVEVKEIHDYTMTSVYFSSSLLFKTTVKK